MPAKKYRELLGYKDYQKKYQALHYAAMAAVIKLHKDEYYKIFKEMRQKKW